jgi:hypothetical protein
MKPQIDSVETGNEKVAYSVDAKVLSCFRERHARALEAAVAHYGLLREGMPNFLHAVPGEAILAQMEAHWEKTRTAERSGSFSGWFTAMMISSDWEGLVAMGNPFGEALRQAHDLIAVVHCCKCKGEKPTFYVGRGSLPRNWQVEAHVGNPFLLGVHGDRAGVVKLYRDKVLRGELEGLLEALFTRWKNLNFEAIQLACWCSPAACHGDVIKDWLLCRWLEHSLNPQ